jgi:hypothetical protein
MIDPGSLLVVFSLLRSNQFRRFRCHCTAQTLGKFAVHTFPVRDAFLLVDAERRRAKLTATEAASESDWLTRRVQGFVESGLLWILHDLGESHRMLPLTTTNQVFLQRLKLGEATLAARTMDHAALLPKPLSNDVVFFSCVHINLGRAWCAGMPQALGQERLPLPPHPNTVFLVYWKG